MTTQAVHWKEGMFMRPHHFQASLRYLLDQMRRSHQWDMHYGWGIRTLDIDLDALADQKLVIRRLEARLRDGTLVNVPDDGDLPVLQLKEPLQKQSSLFVYLAVPALHLGRANVVSSTAKEDYWAPTKQAADQRKKSKERYWLQQLQIADENTGLNPQDISVRRLNLKIVLGNADQTGYESLPLARITKGDLAEAAPQLDPAFIPPLLSCDGWPPLHTGILHALHERISRKIDWLVNQMASRGITFDRHAQGDDLILLQLRKLNEAFAVMQVLLHAQGVHPLLAYLELSRVVGQLAIFGAAKRVPDLPRYHHDDLHGCFHRLNLALGELLDIFAEPEYRERPFVGAGLRMQVALEPSWLEPSWQLFVGVRSSLDDDACVDLLTRPGELDMKIGSSDRVENIFREGRQGLRFELQKLPPRSLPATAGWVYFQVKRQTQDVEWKHVQNALLLAVRINERLIQGSIQNQRMLTIRTPNKTATMEFMLFAVPA